VNASLYNMSTSAADEVQSADLNSIGQVLVSATDSFFFVDNTINQLNSYGVDLGAFLQIYATAYTYLAASSNPATIITWNTDIANSHVYNWYSELNTCYNTVFQATQTSGGGAQYFFQAIKKCYGEYAFIYRSANSVYNISLANDSSYYRTPYESQYIYTLPTGGGGKNETLTTADYVIIALVLIGIIIGLVYFLRRVMGKKMRRRVSFEGERLAARTVDNLTESHEDRTYFHGKQYGQTFLGRLSGTFTRNSYNQGSSSTNIVITPGGLGSNNPLQQQSVGVGDVGGGVSPLERPLTTNGYPTEGGRLKAMRSSDDEDDRNGGSGGFVVAKSMSRQNIIDDDVEGV